MQKETGGKGGVVVNMSSVVGLDPLFLLPVYSASKEAIVAFTRAFSVSIKRYYTIENSLLEKHINRRTTISNGLAFD